MMAVKLQKRFSVINKEILFPKKPTTPSLKNFVLLTITVNHSTILLMD